MATSDSIIPPLRKNDFSAWFGGYAHSRAYFSLWIAMNRRKRLIPRAAFFVIPPDNDWELLVNIQAFFEIGGLIRWRDQCEWRVDDIDDLASVIIPFFESHPFIVGSKKRDFIAWKRGVEFVMKHQGIRYFDDLLEEFSELVMEIRANQQ